MGPGLIRTIRLLLWLRFRTMFRATRGGSALAGVGIIVLATVSLMLALFFGHLTLEIRAMGNPRRLAAWVHLFLLLLYLMLFLMPLLGFAASEFYDVTKLFHFPVSHRAVFVARVLGLLAGPTVLLFLPSLFAVVAGIPGGAGAGLLRGAVLLFFLFHAVTVAEVLQLALLHVLRSRRFRDLAAVASALLTGGFYVVFQLAMRSGDPTRGVASLLDRGFTDYLAAIPCYWVSSVVVPGAGVGPVLLFLFGLLPLTGLLVLLAGHLQEKAFHGEIALAPVRDPERRAGRVRPVPFPLRLLPDPVRALAGQQWRSLGREPAVKSTLIQQTAFVLLPLLLPILASSGGRAPGIALVGRTGIAAVVFVLSLLSLNLFGLEGRGAATLFATPVPRRRLIAGKVLGALALGALLLSGFFVLLVIVLFALGARPGPSPLLVLLLNGFAALLIVSGVGAVVSVLTPFPLSTRGKGALAPQQAGSREGCLRVVVRLVGLAVAAVLAAPVFLHGGTPGPALLGVAWGALVLAAGIRIAGGMLPGREEEIIRIVVR